MSLTNGYGSGSGNPAISVTGLQEANKKIIFFCLILLKVHSHNFSKINCPKEVITEGIKAFLTFLLDDKGPDPELDPYLCLVDPDPGAQ
jgi:hypothetical protein